MTSTCATGGTHIHRCWEEYKATRLKLGHAQLFMPALAAATWPPCGTCATLPRCSMLSRLLLLHMPCRISRLCVCPEQLLLTAS